MSDVQAISGRPREYLVNGLKEAYFRPLGLLEQGPDLRDYVPFDKRAEACKLLSFLYQLREDLPAGLLLPGLADETPLGTFVDSACGVVEGLYVDCRPTLGMRLPLCSSSEGELKLSHPLTSDILEDARRIVEGGEEVREDDPLSFLRGVRCEGGQFEGIRVKDLVEQAIDHYKGGMRSTGLDLGDYFYGLFSLLLYSEDKSLIEEVLLSRNVLKDAGSIGEVPEEVGREVLVQLYELIGILNVYSFLDERLKTYYLLLLGNDHGNFVDTWIYVPDLIEAGAISKEEAVVHKKGFLKLLESTDEWTKSLAWHHVPRLIRAGVISRKEAVAHKKGFLKLLESTDGLAELLESTDDFVELIEMSHKRAKLLALHDVPDLIKAGVISKEDLTSSQL